VIGSGLERPLEALVSEGLFCWWVYVAGRWLPFDKPLTRQLDNIAKQPKVVAMATTNSRGVYLNIPKPLDKWHG